MKKFKEKLYKFVRGRNGVDQLYYFGFVLMIIFLAADFILQAALPEGNVRTVVGLCTSIASLAILVWSVFRVMSRNLIKRRRENATFLRICRSVKRFFSGNTSRGTKSSNFDDASYIFRDCTKCSSTLRLQRKAGRHKVKCPRCSHSFYVKAKEYKYK